MDELSKRIASLSPEQRRLFEQIRREREPTTSRPPTPAPDTPAPDTAASGAPFSLISQADREQIPPGIEDAYPIGKVQLGMLFHMEIDESSPAPPIFHNVNTFHLQIAFDNEAFERAINLAVKRHPMLRTSFDLTSFSEPLQLVHASAHLSLGYEDLRGLSEKEQQSAVEAFVEAEHFRLVDITRPPLIHFHAFCLSDKTARVVLTEPHSIADGWSTHLTVREILENYHALLHDLPLPEQRPLAVTYREFIELERAALGSQQCRNFWDEKLADRSGTTIPRWPMSNARSTGIKEHRRYTAIDPDVVSRLRKLASLASVSFKSILLAGHLKVVSILSGQQETLTGVVFNGRPEVRDGDTVRGLFLNSLPFPLDLASGNWIDLAQQVQQAEVDILPHRRYPLAVLQRKNLGQPIFEVEFSYHHFHSMRELAKKTDVQMLSGGSDYSRANFPLGVRFRLDPQCETKLTLLIEHDVESFPPEQIDAICGTYERVLEAMSLDPEANHNSPDFLSDPGRDDLRRWNQTDVEYAGVDCLHRLFEKQTAATPDTIALVSDNQQLTYAELNAQADALANGLRGMNVGPESCVAICAHRSIELVTGLLGILKAGAAYLPLDPEYPPSRLRTMIADASPTLLLAQSQLVEPLGELPMPVHSLAADWNSQASPDRRGQSLVDLENPAYVIYTSGSTGTPKGVVTTHRGICNRLFWMQDRYQLNVGDHVLQKTSIGFDVSVWEFFWPLITGATLVMARPGGHRDPEYLKEVIRERNVTVMHFVPSMLREFLNYDDSKVASLRAVICSGEELTSRDVEIFLSKCDGVGLHNLYGPTEASIDVSAWECGRNDVAGSVPIGHAIANTQLHIANSAMTAVPVLVPGELHLGGTNLARGYLGRPDLTADRFLPDPFSGRRSERVYRTGDRTQRLPGGEIEFLGRLDNQIKIRGSRVELGEIESHLLRQPSVRQALVVAQPDPTTTTRLVAYIVNNNECSTTDGDLRTYLGEQLPAQMIPKDFVFLDKFPLTANGKLDRKALPQPEALATTSTSYVGPRDERERILAEIWTRVLRLERVGVHDNFFELGGDSILGLQIAAHANRAGLRLRATQVFDHQTIAELARNTKSATAAAAEQGIVTGLVPLTPIQRWFLESAQPNPQHFNLSRLMEVPGELNESQWQRIVQLLITHHDALRLRIQSQDGSWYQELTAAAESLPYEQVDISSLSPPEQERVLEATAVRAHQSLSFLDGRLLQIVRLHRDDGQTDWLFLTVHHLAVDGVSLRILLEDLGTLCSQSVAGKELQLPPKTSSYQQWARQLVEYSSLRELLAERSYWLDSLRRNADELSADHPGGDNTFGSLEVVAVSLDEAETTKLLRTMPTKHKTQINEVLLAAVALALARRTGRTAFWIDVEGHGREEIAGGIDVSRTVGWFTSSYPVRLEVADGSDPRRALASVKSRLRAIPRRGIGYGALRFLTAQEEFADRCESHEAAILFNYMGQFQSGASASDSLVKTVNKRTGATSDIQNRRSHAIEVNGIVTDGQLHVRWAFSPNLHERPTIEQFAECFLQVLRALISDDSSSSDSVYTPTDFPLAKLNQQQLDKILRKTKSNK